ncbi:uncharacterized protein F4817DRAFT_348985 [Daldinia loculata]|uniref:uncharacterized protein n=1 Tax=Daldinia loculata TaxID=103429 RepID=UPI0020C51BA4|nr:uncharacterized protein F4817DRAFT_348985 [Daldinia loculata]KAI1643663.1 hypothetical protein F4817DRAFT_348985 [Daldinia loculata]
MKVYLGATIQTSLDYHACRRRIQVLLLIAVWSISVLLPMPKHSRAVDVIFLFISACLTNTRVRKRARTEVPSQVAIQSYGSQNVVKGCLL